MQLSYLGKSQDTKNDKFSHKQLIVYCRYRLVSDEGERGIRLQGHVTVKESQAVVIAELMVLVPFNQ